MPRKTSAAGRRLSKADDAIISMPADTDLEETGVAEKADDDKKPWEVDDKDPKDAASKADDDDDDDEDDDTSKADCDDDDDMGKSGGFSADLRKAVRLLTRHGEQHDPSLRKEALMAKELKGGGLSKSERAELVACLQGREATGSAHRVGRATIPGPALRKSMVDNSAFAEAYDNLTKSVTAQAQHLDAVCKSISDTNYLMARVLTKASDTIGEVYDRQEKLGTAVESLSRQPAHGPRSAGLGWAEKSFSGGGADAALPGARGGKLEKSSPGKVRQALEDMAKSVPAHSEMRQACKLARDSLLLGRPLMPSMYAKIEQHMAAQDS